jgi:hypothetical protein
MLHQGSDGSRWKIVNVDVIIVIIIAINDKGSAVWKS